MQAWEQQVASLSRQVAKVTSEQEDAQRERQTLLDSLRASEQVGRSHQEAQEVTGHESLRGSVFLLWYCQGL